MPLSESDLALFPQTYSSQLHTAPANLGKHSARELSWHNNHREHGLGSTYLLYFIQSNKVFRVSSQELGFRTLGVLIKSM